MTQFWVLSPSFHFCGFPLEMLDSLAQHSRSPFPPSAPLINLHIPNLPSKPRSQMPYGIEQQKPQERFLSSLGFPKGLKFSTALSGHTSLPSGK